ncbi:MAG: DUF4037 domain-containing protein [Caldilineaceae bacterium]|nr:DUF4037 domain-containing protein [Caldilineaceae bacterium]
MSMPPAFIPGLTLNRRFYLEVVRPLLDRHLPGLIHSAGLMGYGSDVLGYDTPMSTDHNWGPRLQLFLSPHNYAEQAEALDALLRTHLPPTFEGYSVHFSQPNLADNGTQVVEPYTGGPVNHPLSILTVDEYFSWSQLLARTPDAPLTAWDWLAFPEQKLLEVTAGEVFHDGLGTLGSARERFSYYPDDVWKVKLAAQWQRIAEEEAFVGRTGDLGDEIGSWIISARLTRDLMRLSFLYARRYAPYSKWLGTAFAHLPIATDLLPTMQALSTASNWHEREAQLTCLYRRLATEHNTLGITEPLSIEVRNFFGRPYQVLFAGRFAEAVNATISDPSLRNLARIGAVDQFTDTVAIHSNSRIAAKLKSIYSNDKSIAE